MAQQFDINSFKAFGSSKKVMVVFIVTLLLAFTALIAARISANLTQQSPDPIPSPTTIAPTPSCDLECTTVKLRALAGEEPSPAFDLAEFAIWLKENNQQGLVGEYGWPALTSDRYNPIWDQQATDWVKVAEATDLWTTAWASGSNWGSSYALTIHTDSDGDKILDTTNSQAAILAPLLEKDSTKHGINLAGLEFGTQRGDFNNTNPGVVGVDYFAENPESFAYLNQNNVNLVRLPIRWERIQPALNQPLDQPYLDLITNILNGAQANDVDVILDLHNYAEYSFSSGVSRLGSAQLPETALLDLWSRLAANPAGQHPAVVMLDIMNEPHSVVAQGQTSEARTWEATSQAVLEAIRSVGNNKTVAIPGYDWSDLADWRKNHPSSWINDPANNFLYTAHHYWDEGQRGQY